MIEYKIFSLWDQHYPAGTFERLTTIDGVTVRSRGVATFELECALSSPACAQLDSELAAAGRAPAPAVRRSLMSFDSRTEYRWFLRREYEFNELRRCPWLTLQMPGPRKTALALLKPERTEIAYCGPLDPPASFGLIHRELAERMRDAGLRGWSTGRVFRSRTKDFEPEFSRLDETWGELRAETRLPPMHRDAPLVPVHNDPARHRDDAVLLREFPYIDSQACYDAATLDAAMAGTDIAESYEKCGLGSGRHARAVVVTSRFFDVWHDAGIDVRHFRPIRLI